MTNNLNEIWDTNHIETFSSILTSINSSVFSRFTRADARVYDNISSILSSKHMEGYKGSTLIQQDYEELTLKNKEVYDSLSKEDRKSIFPNVFKKSNNWYKKYKDIIFLEETEDLKPLTSPGHNKTKKLKGQINIPIKENTYNQVPDLISYLVSSIS